jgi:hypothetical protein
MAGSPIRYWEPCVASRARAARRAAVRHSARAKHPTVVAATAARATARRRPLVAAAVVARRHSRYRLPARSPTGTGARHGASRNGRRDRFTAGRNRLGRRRRVLAPEERRRLGLTRRKVRLAARVTSEGRSLRAGEESVERGDAPLLARGSEVHGAAVFAVALGKSRTMGPIEARARRRARGRARCRGAPASPKGQDPREHPQAHARQTSVADLAPQRKAAKGRCPGRLHRGPACYTCRSMDECGYRQ